LTTLHKPILRNLFVTNFQRQGQCDELSLPKQIRSVARLVDCASVRWPRPVLGGDNADGMIFTKGGNTGGSAFFLKDGNLDHRAPFNLEGKLEEVTLELTQ